MAEGDKNIAEANARVGRYDESGPRKVYEEMKKTDPAGAEKFWAMIEGIKAQAAKDAAAAAKAPPIVNSWVKQLEDLTRPARVAHAGPVAGAGARRLQLEDADPGRSTRCRGW